MARSRGTRGTLLSLVLILQPILGGCSQPATTTPTTDPKRFRVPEEDQPLYDHHAKVALQSIGIEREVVSSMVIPMALDRLLVVIASLNPEVPDLTVAMMQTEQGWRLQSPTMAELADWLHRSQRR